MPEISYRPEHAGSVDIDAEALMEEVRRLWRREAARGTPLSPGPQLRRICGITELDGARETKTKLTNSVERCLKDHGEHRLTMLTAFGLHPPAQQATLEGRLAWLAATRHVSARTARRQLDAAVEVFVREAAATMARSSSASGEVGYEVVALAVTLKLAGERPAVIERRRIRVVHDRLPAFQCWFGVPGPQRAHEPRFAFDLVTGGRRCYDVRQEGGVIKYRVEPWQPLVSGQEHEFEVTYAFPPGQPMAPHCVVQPAAPFGTFDLTVQFDPCEKPDRVWRVDGVLNRAVDSYSTQDEILLPDPSAEVRAAFHSMREGRSYGLAWEWA